MKSARLSGIIILLLTFMFNEWAFRFIFDYPAIDIFMRLITVLLDGFIAVLVITLLFSRSTLRVYLQNLRSNSPKLTMLYVGAFTGFCMLVGVEFGCRFYFKKIYEAPFISHSYWEPSANIKDDILGSKLPASTEISHAYVVNDSLIYKQYYTTDDRGRRITPHVYPDSIYTEFAMVTGCSFAFGYGVNDYSTLSYFLDSISEMRGYNYGIAGHGTQQTLALLQSKDLTSELKETNGVLIHLFIDDHFARLVGSRRLIKRWAANFPYFRLEDGKLKRDGSFVTGRKYLTFFYQAISESAFIDLFDIEFPWYTSNGHMELFTAVLKESRSEFLSQFPNGKFLVVVGPNSKLAPRVVARLNEANVDVLDLSELLNKNDPQYKIHYTEAHPTALYYQEIALAIDQYLARSE